MHSFRKYLPAIFLIAAALSLVGVGNGEEGTDEQTKLVEQQKQLNARISTLKVEQDYLRFLKIMYESDSKYLVFNIASKTGQLKYKNRVLKDFHFTVIRGRANALAAGEVRLTKKIEDSRQRDLLIFGESFILQGKRAPANRLKPGVPRLLLSKKDLSSIFVAVETGAMAYLRR